MVKFKEIFNILILLYTIVQITPSFAKSPRIIGGTTTTVSQEPYVVQILKNGRFSCGGTLVSSRFVVTAGHCAKGQKPRTLTIVGGASKLSDTGVRTKVSKIMIPNGYAGGTMNMDVAVLKLSKTLTGTNIKPISLCTKAWPAGATVRVSGWGITSENSKKPSNQLRTVQVKGIAKAKCSANYRRQLTKSMTCASIPGAKDACSGDSGGPAVYNGQLCGIVSWGIGCARSAYPGVYTNVVAVRKFIQTAMTK